MADSRPHASRRGYWGMFLRYEVIIFGLVGVLSWVLNQRTLQAYGNGLIIAGVVVMALVIYSFLGYQGITRDWLYLYGSSVSDKELNTETGDRMREQNTMLAQLFPEIFIGLFPMLVGGIFQFL